MKPKGGSLEALTMLLRMLKLPTFNKLAEDVACTATQEGWTFQQYLHHLATLEVEEHGYKWMEEHTASVA